MLVVVAAAALAHQLVTVDAAGVAVDVFTPPGPLRGDVLVLPGWSSTRKDWCAHGLCELAAERGLRLVMPEMGKSVYSWGTFPETKPAYRAAPDRKRLVEEVLPALRARGLLAPRFFVLGRSTGARGAVLLALDLPREVIAAGALSGDYDARTLQHDPLLVGVYGPFAAFSDRFLADDPASRAASLEPPLFLGHGERDRVVPADQTRLLADAIAGARGACTLHLDPDGDHSHGYWRRALPEVLDFFVLLLGAARTDDDDTRPRDRP